MPLWNKVSESQGTKSQSLQRTKWAIKEKTELQKQTFYPFDLLGNNLTQNWNNYKEQSNKH